MIMFRNREVSIEDIDADQWLKELQADDVVWVDWCQSHQTIDELIQAYLPLVETLHRLGHQVKVRMPLVRGVQFSQHQPPIVFCGHTYNPFRFDQVNYCFKEISHASR